MFAKKILLESFSDIPGLKQFRSDWMKCLDGDRGGVIYLHPDLIFSGKAQGRDGLVAIVAQRGEQDSGEICCLAILRSFDKRISVIPGLSLHLALRARKLVSNRILGTNGHESLAAFIRAFAKILVDAEVDHILFEDIEVSSPLWDALENVLEPGVAVLYPTTPQPHWWIRFPDPAEDYWKKFSSRTRYNLRSRAKKLRHTITCYREREQVPLFLDKAHRVSLATWQSRKLGLRIRNSPEERKYWELVASHGALRSYVLEQDGCPLAFMLGIQWKGCFVSEEIGYDPAYAVSAPGTVLHFRIIEDLIADDTPASVDFGFGDSEYKRVFGNQQTMSGPVVMVRRALYPMGVAWLEQARRMMGGGVRASLNRLGLLSSVRRLSRRS